MASSVPFDQSSKVPITVIQPAQVCSNQLNFSSTLSNTPLNLTTATTSNERLNLTTTVGTAQCTPVNLTSLANVHNVQLNITSAIPMITNTGTCSVSGFQQYKQISLHNSPHISKGKSGTLQQATLINQIPAQANNPNISIQNVASSTPPTGAMPTISLQQNPVIHLQPSPVTLMPVYEGTQGNIQVKTKVSVQNVISDKKTALAGMMNKDMTVPVIANIQPSSVPHFAISNQFNTVRFVQDTSASTVDTGKGMKKVLLLGGVPLQLKPQIVTLKPNTVDPQQKVVGIDSKKLKLQQNKLIYQNLHKVSTSQSKIIQPEITAITPPVSPQTNLPAKRRKSTSLSKPAIIKANQNASSFIPKHMQMCLSKQQQADTNSVADGAVGDVRWKAPITETTKRNKSIALSQEKISTESSALADAQGAFKFWNDFAQDHIPDILLEDDEQGDLESQRQAKTEPKLKSVLFDGYITEYDLYGLCPKPLYFELSCEESLIEQIKSLESSASVHDVLDSETCGTEDVCNIAKKGSNCSESDQTRGITVKVDRNLDIEDFKKQKNGENETTGLESSHDIALETINKDNSSYATNSVEQCGSIFPFKKENLSALTSSDHVENNDVKHPLSTSTESKNTQERSNIESESPKLSVIFVASETCIWDPSYEQYSSTSPNVEEGQVVHRSEGKMPDFSCGNLSPVHSICISTPSFESEPAGDYKREFSAEEVFMHAKDAPKVVHDINESKTYVSREISSVLKTEIISDSKSNFSADYLDKNIEMQENRLVIYKTTDSFNNLHITCDMKSELAEHSQSDITINENDPIKQECDNGQFIVQPDRAGCENVLFSEGGENLTKQFSNGTVKHCNADNIPIDYDVIELTWEEYLEETGAVAAPAELFDHVETSIRNCFEQGQIVEVRNEDPMGTYWVARIIIACGQLLGLQYLRSQDDAISNEHVDDDESSDSSEKVDVWCDAYKADIHPTGWCAENWKLMLPPFALECVIEDVDDFLSVALKDAVAPSSYLFETKVGTAPIDFLTPGLWFEVQDDICPIHVWLAVVVRNVGGRLLLRYLGVENDSHDFWVFYLNYRIHPVCWARDRHGDGFIYHPPDILKIDTALANTDWTEKLMNCFRDEDLKNSKPAFDFFKDQEDIEEHGFKVGSKLEALHPKLRCAICPATVVKVFNKYFFLVQIDEIPPQEAPESSPSEKFQICCHKNSSDIFPVRWCVRSGLRLLPPIGWKASTNFDWKDYLPSCNSEPAPEKYFNLAIPDHDFCRGMKVEAVNPDHPEQICAATIIRIVENLMWIHLDTSSKIVSNQIVGVRSQEIFPVGWCECNNYPLKLPRKIGAKKKLDSNFQIEKPMTADEYRSAAYNQMVKGEGNVKIYFNHRCFSGGFLSKGRVAELPRSVGPGPVVLVMKEVLTMLMNAAYKSSRVLRELQLDGPPNPSMHQQVLKAKYKGKRYCALVEICRDTSQIEEFCRQVCIKLECCPLLISTECIEGECPENCSLLTKTKYSACYGKSKLKMPGRPPGSQSGIEFGKKKPGRKRKCKRGRKPMYKDNASEIDGAMGENDCNSICGSVDSNEKLDEEVASIIGVSDDQEIPPKKRKYDRKVLPPTKIKTRGVKLPSYSTAMNERRPRALKIKDLLPPEENSPIFPPLKKRKVGRPRKNHSPLDTTTAMTSETTYVSTPSPTIRFEPAYTFSDEPFLRLKNNPLFWDVQGVVEFIEGTDCCQFSSILKEQDVDGESFLMLTLDTVQELLDHKLGPSLKFCYHIERLKLALYQQFLKNAKNNN